MNDKFYLPVNPNLEPLFRKLNVSNVNVKTLKDVIALINDPNIININDIDKYLNNLTVSSNIQLENLIIDLIKLLAIKLNSIQSPTISESDPIFTNWLNNNYRELYYSRALLGYFGNVYPLPVGDNQYLQNNTFLFTHRPVVIDKIYLYGLNGYLQPTTISIDIKASTDNVNFSSIIGPNGNYPAINNNTYAVITPSNWITTTIYQNQILIAECIYNNDCTFLEITVECHFI